jgi:hypothetical protein
VGEPTPSMAFCYRHPSWLRNQGTWKRQIWTQVPASMLITTVLFWNLQSERGHRWGLWSGWLHEVQRKKKPILLVSRDAATHRTKARAKLSEG